LSKKVKIPESNELFLGLEIEVNHGCNMTCSYCPNSKTERKEQGHMSEEVFLALMSQLRDLHYKGRLCYHFYNEPLTSKNLEHFVRISKDYCPETKSEIYTNGTLLTKERFLSLEESGVDRFYITKHESTPFIAFDKTLTLLDENQKNKVRYVGHEDLILSNRGGELDVGPTPPLKLPCHIPRTSVVITLKGNVLTCYEDFSQKNEMGNILDKHIGDIWTSSNYVQFREDLKKGKRELYEVCRKCNNQQII
jgi:radical SAM protein with 4Fe4S-binding SPASM domain